MLCEKMRPEPKDKLDREEARRKRKWILVLLGIMCPFLIYGLIFFPASSATVQGEVVGLTAIQTEVGSLPRVRVKLDSGKFVRAKMTQQQPFYGGSRVLVQERRALLGFKSYRILSYIGEE